MPLTCWFQLPLLMQFRNTGTDAEFRFPEPVREFVRGTSPTKFEGAKHNGSQRRRTALRFNPDGCLTTGTSFLEAGALGIFGPVE